MHKDSTSWGDTHSYCQIKFLPWHRKNNKHKILEKDNSAGRSSILKEHQFKYKGLKIQLQHCNQYMHIHHKMCITVIDNGCDYYTVFSSHISVNILFQTSVLATLNLRHGEVPMWHMTLKYIKNCMAVCNINAHIHNPKLYGCTDRVHPVLTQATLHWQSPPYTDRVHPVLTESTLYWHRPPCTDRVHPVLAESTLYWQSPPTYWHVACQYDFPLTVCTFYVIAQFGYNVLKLLFSQ
jgi:hypothetical protein